MSPPSSTQVLDQFAVAYRRSSAALAEFLAAYPDHAEDLVDYAHELNLSRECAGERSISPEDEQWIEAEAARFSTAGMMPVDPFARLQPRDYVEVRKALDVPSVVLEAFRDRMVNVAGVPLPFLRRLSEQLKVSLADFALFLEGQPRLAPNMAYKADAAPRAPVDKISFASLLDQAGVPADRAATLLAEDE